MAGNKAIETKTLTKTVISSYNSKKIIPRHKKGIQSRNDDDMRIKSR